LFYFGAIFAAKSCYLAAKCRQNALKNFSNSRKKAHFLAIFAPKIKNPYKTTHFP